MFLSCQYVCVGLDGFQIGSMRADIKYIREAQADLHSASEFSRQFREIKQMLADQKVSD